MKKYNVYIVKNDKLEATLIGKELSENQADRRVMNGLMVCDKDNYFVTDVLLGSEEDLKYHITSIKLIKE
jgi:CTP:phosphocholine cytidylyltransferase-like protein